MRDTHPMPVEFNAFLRPGMAFVLSTAERGFVRVFRHRSEYYLHVTRTRWHVERAHCPTWTDATECRCMLGGEA